MVDVDLAAMAKYALTTKFGSPSLQGMGVRWRSRQSHRSQRADLASNSALRIAMVTFDFLPNVGGIASHVAFLTEALRDQGHDVVVINPLPGTRQEVYLDSGVNVPTYRVTYVPGATRVTSVASRARATFQAVHEIASWLGPFDLVHQHDYQSVLAANFIRFHLPWIWTNHTSRFLKDSKSFGKRIAWRIAFSGTNEIICTSEDRLHASRSTWTRKRAIHYIPNGVNLKTFVPDRTRMASVNDTESFVVLCPSRMVAVKGIVYFAEAINIILGTRVDLSWKFILIGKESSPFSEDEYQTQVQHLLVQHEISGSVEFHGNIRPERMVDMYQRADIAVLPSLMEAVSLSALEAMACGVPVIATDVGGLPEIVRHEETGILVEPRNARALADAIMRLRQDAHLAQRLASAARRMVTAEYTWQLVATRTVTLYRRALVDWSGHKRGKVSDG